MLAGQVRAGEAEEDLLNLQAFAGARRIPPQAPQELRTTPGAEAEASVQNTSLAEPHLFPANARACGACSTWRPRVQAPAPVLLEHSKLTHSIDRLETPGLDSQTRNRVGTQLRMSIQAGLGINIVGID